MKFIPLYSWRMLLPLKYSVARYQKLYPLFRVNWKIFFIGAGMLLIVPLLITVPPQRAYIFFNSLLTVAAATKQ